jgi:phage regulator Rha-like protein/phage antirepressor YoqD-like protein
MNNNNITTITDQQTITSMEIAEITGKKHYHVLRAIRVMEPAWEKIAASKFGCSSIKDKSGKMIPLFILNQKECLFVATKFNDEARAKLVLRWEQLEKERQTQQSQQSVSNNQQSVSNVPVDPRNMSRLQILQLALAAEEENQKLQQQVNDLEADKYGMMIDLGQKEQEISHLQERTRYLDVIDCQRDTVIVSQIAQDYGMSAVAFNDLLKGLRVQRKMGEQWILYADYLNKGYVANRMIPIHHAGRADTYKPMTVWTQSGRKFLYDKLKKHGVLPLVERNMPAVQQS